MPLFILFSFFLISMSAFSETHVLLIDAGNSAQSNAKLYYNEIRRGYEVARSIGLKTKVIAKDGTWHANRFGSFSNIAYTKEGKESKDPNIEEIPSYPPIEMQAKYANDIIKAIRTFKPAKDDTVLIYITGKGKTSGSRDPSKTGIGAWRNSFSYEELGEELKKLPKDIKIKIVSKISYSGGVHHIAHTLPNVCTAANAAYYTSPVTNRDEIMLESDFNKIMLESDFNKGFWGELKEKGKDTSFAEMNIAGLRKDKSNLSMGNLSSWDYMDFVLGKKKYKPIWRTTYWPPHLKKLFKPIAQLLDIRLDSPLGLFNLPMPERNAPDSTQACKTEDCDSDSGLADLEKLHNLSNLVKQVKNKPPLERLQIIFDNIVEDMKKNGKEYEKIASDYDRQYKDLKKDWDQYLKKIENKRKEKNLSPDWQKEVGSEKAKFQSKVDALQKKATNALGRYVFNHKMLDKLGSLDEFKKKATTEQKQKFMQLLNCELEPL